jgi:transcriptional regulator with XRE-family HTH domain
MRERLQEILDTENLSPSRFAELIGVQRSSVSHILSGRNRPGLDFLQKVLVHFEHISPDWLISGKGPYKRYLAEKNENTQVRNSGKSPNTAGTIEFPETPPAKEEDRVPYLNRQESTESKRKAGPHSRYEKTAQTSPDNNVNASPTNADPESKDANPKPESGKRIVKTILFYEDQTFEVFYPASP